MSKDNIKLTLSAKDLASGVIGRVKMSTIALGTAVGNLATKMLTGAINGIRGWINEALEAEKANVMLDAALRGVGSYTPELSKRFRDLAGAIQDETGASDEAVKSTIAQLTTMGVAADQMDKAARAVQALASLGRDGAQSMVAVARALEGDITGFNRLAPSVRTATTLTEKYEAANQLLAAGYAQQQATLQTVGGAWEALKGRIGDAREDIIGAIFEGTKIGTTFNEAQAAVGKFLASDSFQNFTNALRDGAAYAKDILKALTSGNGGFSETAGAIGSVILAALQDGAHYVYDQIKAAFAGTLVGKLGGAFGRNQDFFRGVGGMVGALLAGASFDEARRMGLDEEAYARDSRNQPRASALDAALAKLDAVLKERAGRGAPAGAGTSPSGVSAPPDDNAVADLNAGLAAAKAKEIAEIEAKIAAIKEERAKARDIAIIQDRINDAAEAEAKARDALAKAEAERLNAAEGNINQWIADRKKSRDQEKQNAKDLAKAQKKATDLIDKQKRGVRLNRRDQEWLEAFQANRALAGGNAADAAAAALRQAQEQRDLLQRQMKRVQDKQLDELEKLNALLDKNLRIPS